MKRAIYTLPVILILINGALIFLAPDRLSKIFVVVMLVLDIFGIFMNIFPMLSITNGLYRGIAKITEMQYTNTDSMFDVAVQTPQIFGQKKLESLYQDYKDKIVMQNSSGQILGDIEEYINEDSLLTISWNNVVSQVPGTLTGLGILGTFIGLIFGIRGIGFSSIEAALNSVETLVSGIYIAFYTSIAGVFLSILFNILQKIIRNMMERNLTRFVNLYHTAVIPTEDEQAKYRENRTFQEILSRLDRIPKTPGFSIASSSYHGNATANSPLLMPQIIDGLKKNEFTFFLQPKYDINTKQPIAAEAFVRWHHPHLGLISPSVFLPIVEDNGYIVKLDTYIWTQVIQKIHEWTEAGIKMVPISVNISKTDILAGNVAEFLRSQVTEYQVSPRMLDVEIAKNAFLSCPELTNETVKKLRDYGFRIILDGYDGDIVQLSSIDQRNIDAVKLDLRLLQNPGDKNVLMSIFTQTRSESAKLLVEGIETMNEISTLRKCGCSEGQGYYFSKPLSQDEFVSYMQSEMLPDSE